MTPTDRELLRIEIIKLMALNPDTKFRVPVLLSRLSQTFPHITFDETDLSEALVFFEGLNFVVRLPSPYDGPVRWQITQSGRWFYENNP